MEDEYFVSSLTDQNVKLRFDQLKLKPLLARLDDGLELYEESARLLFDLPSGEEDLVRAAGLLGVSIDAGASNSREDVIRLLSDASPVRFVRVRKRRTQYALGNGWAELAEIWFPRASVWSLGVQSSRIDETRDLRRRLDPEHALEPIGYVEACRRWG